MKYIIADYSNEGRCYRSEVEAETLDEAQSRTLQLLQIYVFHKEDFDE